MSYYSRTDAEKIFLCLLGRALTLCFFYKADPHHEVSDCFFYRDDAIETPTLEDWLSFIKELEDGKKYSVNSIAFILGNYVHHTTEFTEATKYFRLLFNYHVLDNHEELYVIKNGDDLTVGINATGNNPLGLTTVFTGVSKKLLELITPIPAVEIALRYQKVISQTTSDVFTHSLYNQEYLQRMLQIIIDRHQEFSEAKLYSWIGFISGVLAVLNLINITDERNWSRPIYQKYYRNKGIPIPESISVTI